MSEDEIAKNPGSEEGGEEADEPSFGHLPMFQHIREFSGIFQPSHENKLYDKLTESQVSEILRYSENESARSHSRKQQYFWGALTAFLLLCFLFLAYEKAEFLKEVVALFVGLAGGYGLGKYKSESE